MLTLTSAQVTKYKSIDDSTVVDISPEVTVLVGKNESGKTAFLEALHKANAQDKAKYDYVSDYPRKELIRYRPLHEKGQHSRVVTMTFAISDALVEKINKEVFRGATVIETGSSFTRSTTIGNQNTIGFDMDEAKALAALKNSLGDLEHKEKVFDGADTLEEVIEAIEALQLPADGMLATFAAAWRKETSKNWGLIDGCIFRKYLSPAIPKFLYFDDYKLLEGKINLPSLQQRLNSKQLTDADHTALGLLELAGTSLEELIGDEGYETAKAKLEAIGLQITGQVFQYWKQNTDLDVEFDLKTDAKDVAPFNSGVNLYIRIKNRRHGVTVPFDQRSKGFIWFFSFLVWFDAVQSRIDSHDPLILLLDEPGLNLHALAQADFLSYIRNLAQSHQIVYTTHSPFMVESSRLEEVRVVEDRTDVGTRVTSNLAGSSDESIFPLQAALGYSIAQNLFIAKKNVLVEGPADLILLQHFAAILESKGKTTLGDAVVVPVGGLDKIATFVALLGANKLDIVVLHDKANAPSQRLEELIRQKLIERKRVLDFTLFVDPIPTEADIEDLLDCDVYIEAFNHAYARELKGTVLAKTELVPHPRMVERINLWLKSKDITLNSDGGFNHYRVAQSVLKLVTNESVGDVVLSRFEAVFKRVVSVL